MASTLLGSIRVALGLDTAQFEAGANKSRSIARGMSKDIESSFKSAKIAVEGLVAAFAVGALTEQIKKSLQYAAAIGETATTLGVTTKQLQEYRFAAQQSGVAQEALEGGLQRLTVSIGKAEVGSKAQIKAFNAIGISVDQLKGKNTGQVFDKIADGLKNVTDRSQRAAIEVALFGKAGALLDSLLSGGSARLNALAEAARQLGVVLSDEQIRNAEVTAHKLEALKTVLEANIASTVTANANSILSLAQALSTLTTETMRRWIMPTGSNSFGSLSSRWRGSRANRRLAIRRSSAGSSRFTGGQSDRLETLRLRRPSWQSSTPCSHRQEWRRFSRSRAQSRPALISPSSWLTPKGAGSRRPTVPTNSSPSWTRKFCSRANKSSRPSSALPEATKSICKSRSSSSNSKRRSGKRRSTRNSPRPSASTPSTRSRMRR
jgi:hypothetical protein